MNTYPPFLRELKILEHDEIIFRTSQSDPRQSGYWIQYTINNDPLTMLYSNSSKTEKCFFRKVYYLDYGYKSISLMPDEAINMISNSRFKRLMLFNSDLIGSSWI